MKSDNSKPTAPWSDSIESDNGESTTPWSNNVAEAVVAEPAHCRQILLGPCDGSNNRRS